MFSNIEMMSAGAAKTVVVVPPVVRVVPVAPGRTTVRTLSLPGMRQTLPYDIFYWFIYGLHNLEI